MQFTLKQLAYFVAAGEAGGILRAAENIHVSQPSISNAITHLEDVFQIQLFVRHHAQGMSLTTAGGQMMERARQILRDADELKSLAGVLSDRIYGSINVGCFIPLAPIVTPGLCHGYLQAHDDVEINVSEDDQAELLSHLKKGTIDLALTYDLQLDQDIDFIPLVELKPYVLLAKPHRWRARNKWTWASSPGTGTSCSTCRCRTTTSCRCSRGIESSRAFTPAPGTSRCSAAWLRAAMVSVSPTCVR